MADATAGENTTNAPDAGSEKDPIVTGSLSVHLAIASLLLVFCTLWAGYDEFFGRRPWKKYLSAYPSAYKSYLEDVEQQQATKEEQIKADPEYRQLQEALLAVQDEVAPDRKTLGQQLQLISGQLETVTSALKEARSYTAATIYDTETAPTDEEKERLRDHLAAFHKGPFDVALPQAGGGVASQSHDYQGLLDLFGELQNKKSALRRELGTLVQKESERKKALEAYVNKNLDGLPAERIRGMVAAMDSFRRDITSHQIHVEDVGLVDRCEVCHLATRSPIAVDVEGIRRASPKLSESMSQAFTSHPRIDVHGSDLLRIHDPERFGCTPCHGGNGRALMSVDEAHGRYKHWLWPLHDKEDTEAGCLQCHQDAMRLASAPTLSRGRYLFQRLACWGCHPRDGYDTEAAQLREIVQEETFIESERIRLLKDEDAAYDSDDPGVDPQAIVQAIMQKHGQLDTDADELAIRRASLERARKNPAPSLKEIRAKLNPDWLPAWIRNPRDFRPGTRMPHFRLDEEQVTAIAAFLWQAADDRTPPSYEPGDSEQGKKLFELRGCRACHTLDGTAGFAADLSRVGEKAHPGYLLEWILDPPEWTLMPNLRLDEQEGRDLVAFLMEQKTDATYESVEFLDYEFLYDEGMALVKHFGCFGCHEITGTEDLSRIGTDLTTEGSKPLERLDFALFTHEAKKDGWYSHKGFFERKLSDPSFFDQGKLKLDWEENLKMPDFGLAEKPEDRHALIAFLLGSVDSQLPEFFYHSPKGWDKDIEDGWWVVQKYNCVGCHQMIPGQRPEVWDLPQYQGEGRVTAPPSLVGAGARLEADWLIKFLRNPALSETHRHRNGVRLYLEMRMPSFSLSEEEIAKIVRFLNALSRQPSPYPYEDLALLDEDELADARELFLASECLSCHVTTDDLQGLTPEERAQIKAPGYTVGAERLKPRWMRRWLRDPQFIMPGTVMPSNFHEADGRWKANVALPDDQLRNPDADQIELLIRYQKFFDEEEAAYLQRRQEAKPSSN